MFEVSEPVSALCSQSYKVNEFFEEFCGDMKQDDVADPQALEELIDEVIAVQKAADKVVETAAGSCFENLMVRHVQHSADAQLGWLDYFFLDPQAGQRPREAVRDVASLAKLVFGDNTITVASGYLRALERNRVRLKRASQRLTHGMMDTLDGDGALESMASQLRDRIWQTAIDDGFLPNALNTITPEHLASRVKDAKIAITSKKGGADNDPGWNSDTCTVTVPREHFLVYDRRSHHVINPGRVINDLGHEYIGHGVHQLFSNSLPDCLNADDRNYKTFVAVPTAEGWAWFCESASDRFLKRQRESLGYTIQQGQIIASSLSEEAVRFAKRHADEGWRQAINEGICCYLTLQEREGTIPSAAGAYLGLLRNEKPAKYPIKDRLFEFPQLSKDELYDWFTWLAYPVGRELVRQVYHDASRLARRRGLERTSVITAMAAFAGASWQVYADFVALALENQEAFQKEYLEPLLARTA